ncbi:MAG: hypothetical protein JJU37_06645 [Balneolaceae bacterium]|nr:hypothetical protein [Balneolaceae bacterium]
MKTIVSFVIIGSILLLDFNGLKAQDGGTFEEIKQTYVLKSDASGFSALKSRLGERSISLEEFGQWVVGNMEVHAEVDGRRSDPGPAFPMDVRITIFVVGERGIIAQNGIPVRVSDRPTELSRLVDGNQMGRFIKNTAQSIPTHDDWHPHPEDWYPNPENWSPVQSSRELLRVASDVGSRARGGGAGKVSLVFMVTPDADRFEVPVTPGVAVFVFDVKD